MRCHSHMSKTGRALGVTSLGMLLMLVLVACNHDPKVAEIEFPGSGGEKLFLLTQADGGNGNDAALVGELRLTDGCLQITNDRGSDLRPYTIVWPESFQVAFDGATVLVLDDARRVVTSVGERTLLGGSGGRSDPETIGECPQPFWYAGLEVSSGNAIPSAFD